MTRIARIIYILTQCKDAKDNPAALFARRRQGEWRQLRNLNFGGYLRRVNQSGACSSSDVITSGGGKSQNNNGGQIYCGCMWVPGAVYTSSYFYKNRNTFCNETGAACRSPSHDANSHLLCSEFHARMARFIRVICVWCERTLTD